jgi:hypothetical protein
MLRPSAKPNLAPRSPSRQLWPTRVLRQRYARDVVEALAGLFPAGEYPAADLRGRRRTIDVFITRERRGRQVVSCGVRIRAGAFEFVLDDGADEFAPSRLVGCPAFDHDGNCALSVLVGLLEGGERGSSLWIANDLSMLAIEDEVFRLG